MNTFLQFLVNNWQYISFALVILIQVILFLVKKKPITEIIDNGICTELLDLVIEAEDLYGPGHGSEKLNYVIKIYLARHASDHLGSINESSIKSIVEFILKSPQKKEDK